MNYWAMRTDRNNKRIIWDELILGRLRQGWGYDRSQDLLSIDALWNWDGGDWKNLSEDQRYAAGHFHMLGKGEGSMQPGDIVLLPNLPDDRQFAICRLKDGPYKFEPLVGTGDHGHIRPAELLTQGVDRYAPVVHAQLRETLRTPSRIWNVEIYKEYIDPLVKAAEAGQKFDQGVDVNQKLEALTANVHDEIRAAHSKDLDRFRKLLDEDGELDRLFEGVDWEYVLKTALTALYPNAEVFHTGGAGEKGADLIVQLPNAFNPVRPLLIPVQVKHHQDVGPDWPLDQLRQAIVSYRHSGEEPSEGLGGEIVMAVLATTATDLPAGFEEKRHSLEADLSVPVRVYKRQEVIDLTARGLFARATSRVRKDSIAREL